MNAYSSDAQRALELGSISTDRIQGASNAKRMRLNGASFYDDILYASRITPASGSTVAIDSLDVLNGGVSTDRLIITGKRAAAPTFSDLAPNAKALLWISDGTVTGADGDLMCTVRDTSTDPVTTTTTCIKAFTPYYSVVESSNDHVTPADGSKLATDLVLTDVVRGTYLMSYSLTVDPTTAWEARDWVVWVSGPTTGVLPGSVSSDQQVAASSHKIPHSHSWVQTLTEATETLTVNTKFTATGTHTATVAAAFEPTFYAIRIA